MKSCITGCLILLGIMALLLGYSLWWLRYGTEEVQVRVVSTVPIESVVDLLAPDRSWPLDGDGVVLVPRGKFFGQLKVGFTGAALTVRLECVSGKLGLGVIPRHAWVESGFGKAWYLTSRSERDLLVVPGLDGYVTVRVPRGLDAAPGFVPGRLGVNTFPLDGGMAETEGARFVFAGEGGWFLEYWPPDPVRRRRERISEVVFHAPAARSLAWKSEEGRVTRCAQEVGDRLELMGKGRGIEWIEAISGSGRIRVQLTGVLRTHGFSITLTSR